MQTAQGKLYLFVGIDRIRNSPSSNSSIKPIASPRQSSFFDPIKAVPYRIHTALTDNGIQFRLPLRYADGLTAVYVLHV